MLSTCTTRPSRPVASARAAIRLATATVSVIALCTAGILVPFGTAGAQTTTLALTKFLVAAPPANPQSGTTFPNVATPSTNTTYTYVISVDSAPGAVVTITDNLPTGFTPATGGCSVYIGGTAGPSCTSTSGTFGPYTATGNPGNVTIYIAGSFPSAGPITNTANATDGTSTVTTPLTVTVTALPPSVDLSVVKTASATSVANGTTVSYKSTVTNNSSVAVLMPGFGSLFDRLTNISTTADVDVVWTWVGCSALPSTSTCYDPPAPVTGSASLAPGDSVDIFTTSSSAVTGITAPGNIAPGATMTVEYTVLLTTYDPCSDTDPKVRNTGYLSNGGTLGNLADMVVANNTSILDVAINNIPHVCPPPLLDVSKKVLTNAPQWNSGITYSVLVKNVSTQTIEFSYIDQVHTPAPATTAFDATVAGDTCTVAPCAHSLTPQYFVGSTPKTVITSILPKVTLAPGQQFTLIYKATYNAVCQVRSVPVTIINTFRLKGITITGTPVTTVKHTAIAPVDMPLLERCSLDVKKVQAPSLPSLPIAFGTTYATYTVKWTNPSAATTVRMGSLWDVMSTDNALYATVPVSFGPPTCTAVGGVKKAGGAPWTYSPPGGSLQVSYATPIWQGAKALVLPGAEFPPLASITCTYGAKASQPSPYDPRCQSAGMPMMRNTALADVDPAYNPNVAPFAEKTVQKRLPLCRNVTISKSAVPSPVLPGDPFVWKTVITNNGPTPNGPIGNFWVRDNVPPSGPTRGPATCVPTTNCVPLFSSVVWNTLGWKVRPSNLAALGSVTVNYPARAPITPYTAVQNTAKADPPTSGFYFHDGPAPQGVGSVYTAWPTASKVFAPATVSGGQITTLTFTITNLSYKPAVGGMNFTDALPAGPVYGPVTGNTCGGTAALQPTQLVVTGATLAAGTASCTITLQVRAAGCGTFTNNASDVTGANHVGTAGLQASLTVINCDVPSGPGATDSSGTATTTTTIAPTGSGPVIRITKDVGGPSISGTFVFSVTCGLNTYTATIVYPTPGAWQSPVQPVGTTTCSVAEISATSPVAAWDPPTFTVQGAGASMTGTGTVRTVTLSTTEVTKLFVVNNPASTPQSTQPTGGTQKLIIEKVVWALNTTQAAPAPAGPYVFTITCGSATYTASITFPTPGMWTSPNLPAGTTSCNVTENTPLPTGVPWAGQPIFFKGAPTSPNIIAGTGYTRAVPINPTGNTLLIVVNQRI